MTYLKWRLSNGLWGTGPEGVIDSRGGRADAGWAIDADGYRVGYLTETADLTGLETWNVTELTEAAALAFCRQFYAEAAVLADGRISAPPPSDPVE